MKIPRGRKQAEAGDLRAMAQRQREGEKPAHAIAENGKRRPRRSHRGGERGGEPGDIVRQIEAALLRSGRIPIDDERAQSAGGEMLEKAAPGQQIEDIIAVDQRGHDHDGGRWRAGAIIEKPGRAFLP